MLNTTNEVRPFEYGKHQINLVTIKGESYFVAKDICEALDLKDSNSALRKLDNDEKLISKIYLSGQMRETYLVNESGMYHLVFRSSKEQAKEFRKWVTSEVLPTIRKTGSYQVVAPPSQPQRLTTEQKKLQKLVEKSVKILGSQAKLADRLGCSPAIVSLILNGKMEAMGAAIQSKATTMCQHLVNHGLGYDTESIELLMQIKDDKVRTRLFNKMKEGGAI